MAQQTQKEIVDLYCNLGRDPEPHSFPSKSVTTKVYDEILDEVVDRTWELPERHFMTLSVATGGYGDKPLRWHHVVDWEGVCFRFRSGDRVRLRGYFEIRTYEKDGESKSKRQFVVQNAQLVKAKVREEIP